MPLVCVNSSCPDVGAVVAANAPDIAPPCPVCGCLSGEPAPDPEVP